MSHHLKRPVPREETEVSSFRGKRGHDDWNQVTAYLRQETHRRAKIALVEADYDLSDLLEHLLEDWLDQQAA